MFVLSLVSRRVLFTNFSESLTLKSPAEYAPPDSIELSTIHKDGATKFLTMRWLLSLQFLCQIRFQRSLNMRYRLYIMLCFDYQQDYS